ncbi:MAG: hypothetical protein IT373_26105 [Polyangiaceae bacterium]|nr:hypothetical protein [Polyangiaceae bacterium]
MQQELAAAGLPVDILGVNAAGLEAGNAGVTAGRTLPWLQDTVAVDAWHDWNVTWRDCVILDGNNQVVTVYNLTVHNLADPASYAELRTLFEAAATGL